MLLCLAGVGLLVGGHAHAQRGLPGQQIGHAPLGDHAPVLALDVRVDGVDGERHAWTGASSSATSSIS